ncbi:MULTISPECIES: dihydrolipoamide acetyltransferase family protein [unclassified Nocardioides]|uniref:dihydrolipoamide acetyltransferase family protein n=1 Tax=unclassified Nocardioides TaxID=2615069 RepID=UPI003621AA05
MAEVLRMPEVLANSVEAILQSWAVPAGAAFRSGEVIATVETEKAVVDVEAERDGVLLTALVADGGTVAVGTPIAVIGDPGEQVEAAEALLRDLGVDAEPAVESPTPSAAAASPPTEDPSGPPPARVFASPLARRIARENDVRLEELGGTGPHGRIRRRDVEEAIARRRDAASEPAPAPAPVLVDAPGDEQRAAYVDEPHSRLRRAIARRLTESKQEVPHFYLRATCHVDRLLELRAEVNRSAERRVSVNDLVVKAAARALRDVPDLNVTWTEDAVRHHESVDVAVAMASDRGLVTPVLRSVDRLPVGEVAAHLKDLRGRADDGRLRQDELEGGTLTITNLGMFGTEEFAAIINPPHAAILAVGAAREEPVARDGEVVVARVLRVTLSVDHRSVDGAAAARWLTAFVAAVEDPIRLLV